MRKMMEKIQRYDLSFNPATEKDIVTEVVLYTDHLEGVRVLKDALVRAQRLVSLITVRQVLEGGSKSIEAAGLNPWCINEGLADGSENINTWWLDNALNEVPDGE